MAKYLPADASGPEEEQPLQERMFGPVRPEDENTYPASPRNYIAEQIGLTGAPWQMSRADEKRYNQGLPEMMGTAMGRLSVAPASAAEAVSPELMQWARMMKQTPRAPIEVSGPINMQSFQKLRDMLGHTGPIIMKGK